MKNILGLDLGPNSIGWAVVQTEKEGAEESLFAQGKILMAGSRIIPMDASTLGDFEKGNSTSQTADRTKFRQVRRQYERFHQRRERLNRVLLTLDFLPEHYAKELDRYGKLPKEGEPKLAWRPTPDGAYEFLFRDAFLEMVSEFKKHHPELKQISYDWTIYYLRKKALRQALTPHELSWVLHSFNQKRGYNAVRGKEDKETESPDKRQEYHKSVLTSISDTGEKLRGNVVYRLAFSDGATFDVAGRHISLSEGEEVEYIKTTKLDEDGMPKLTRQGVPDVSYKIPNADDAWTLNKLRAEFTIEQSGTTVGEYIYDAILRNPGQKIRGELVRTIDRRFYRDELCRILETQIPLHPALQNMEILEECLLTLYPNNEAHRLSMLGRGFKGLFMDDVILYQRPLKSKKSLIDDCKYESRTYVNQDGARVRVGLKCASRSHPLFQEYRLWQFMENLRILKRKEFVDGHLRTNVDVTGHHLPDENSRVALFDWLYGRATVDQKALLKYLHLSEEEYSWNYVEEREYPAAETRAEMQKRLKKAGISADFLTPEREMALWEILYSVGVQGELEKALRSFANKHGVDADKFCQSFRTIKPYPADYCAYSTKALRRLLPLMRQGRYWSLSAIDPQTRQRMQRLIDGEWDEGISDRVREKTSDLRHETDFRGLTSWMATYVVYNRHSEAADIKKWHNPEEMDADIRRFRQHSLRNPIVEQVCLETLRTVRDIWKEIGKIDEIHVEMGRNMRATAKERQKTSQLQLENEQANLRIKALLQEFMNPEFEVEDVRPYSPSQQELLRIYEGTVLEQEAGHIDEPIREIIRKFSQTDAAKRPTTSEVMRYKLWLEQKYRSPYTGEVIPLGKLFTPAYQIEHVIPQSLYYDNSFNNKVICEAEVNLLKGNQLGMPFIMRHANEKVVCSMGKQVKIFTPEAYRLFVEEHYRGRKMTILLSEEIPTVFNDRQKNDTRYISRYIIGELSKLVREEKPDGTLEQEPTSKNVVVLNGSVTDKLKKDWGLVDVWNEIITPRFRRLNEMEGSQRFGHDAEKDGKRYFQITMPLELQRGFQRKRIDHRHHAMDAITIACATRQVINYLNNDHSHAGQGREDLRRAVCRKRGSEWFIRKPWDTFTQDAHARLNQIVVSFKRNLRVINKTGNHYWRYNPKTGKKEIFHQQKGDSWAIRQALHKESVFGRVNLRTTKFVSFKAAFASLERIVDKRLKRAILTGMARYSGHCTDKQMLIYLQEQQEWKSFDFKKVAVYTFSEDDDKTRMCAIRKRLDDSFDKKKILSVTDTGIQRILLRHLEQSGGNPKDAFSPEGIVRMNETIQELNGGKPHQPILSVRITETMGNKFAVGMRGNRGKKFVEAAKGTNLFFATYLQEDGKRLFRSLPLNEVVERQKQGLPVAPERDERGNPLLFVLSPGDLVYLPTSDEREGRVEPAALDLSRIYKMVSCSGSMCQFVPHRVASAIRDKYEFSSMNKMERAITGEMIKESCLPLEVDRLGHYRTK